MPDGRVLVGFDDGPLEPFPTWTRLDDPTGSDFPLGWVGGYDTRSGRQSLLSRTDTGEATVLINDNKAGLLDARNASSSLYGKLDGRQIMLQLYNPVTDTWEPQWRGLIDDYDYDLDGSGVNSSGQPVNAAVQIECVDVFDYLTRYGLTPGLDGVVPPAGMEDGVYYAATSGTVDDRIIEILTDATNATWVADMAIVASGNTKVIAVKYDPDRAAMDALRDAADAELPFIANIYVNRFGQFVFRGRYSRFAPDDVAAEPGSDWDFQRWALGDGPAIVADSSRAQMRVLSYTRARENVVNAAMAWPQDLPAADMPDQVYADTTSIADFGKHQADPMSDLLTGDYSGPGSISPGDGKTQCALFAELFVKNQKDPLEAITALQVKAIRPDDPRASATWGVLTESDISHIANVAVGYPGGTGFEGSSPDDDHYIESRQLMVRPLNPVHDYVELTLGVSPAVWSMDTHGVFPPFGS